MTLRDIALRIRALVAPGRVERELGDELAFHLECETSKLVATGLSRADARARALARFGPVALAADRCRDARGTAFVDALVRDLQYAARAFRRAPLAAATIVATLALGLGLVAVVFTLFSALNLQTDEVRNPGELFEIRRPPSPVVSEVWIAFTRPDYEALRRETNVLTDAVAVLRHLNARFEGRVISGTLVTGNFFQVLGAHAALGRTLTPEDDAPSGDAAIVLSDAGWTRLFQRDPSAIGRTLALNGVPGVVVGVMPPGFRGLDVPREDYWAPLVMLGQVRPDSAGREDTVGLEVVGRLRPGVSPILAADALTAWASANPRLQAERGSPKTIRLIPKQGTASPDVLKGLLKFVPFFFAFGLILLIGCANVANLLLARGLSRQREIGIRLSLGASRRRIVRQLLTEALLLALVSASCAFAISRALLAIGARTAMTTASPELAEWVRLAALAADWRLAVFLFGGAIASTLVFGLAPALQATRLELVRTMRGEVIRGARLGRTRSVLVAVQVTASALLLVSAAVFLRSAWAAASVEPGVRISDTAMLEIANEPLRAAMLQAVGRDPSVSAAAATWPPGLGGSPAEASAAAAPIAEATADTSAGSPLRGLAVRVEHKFVSPDYFDLLEIGFVRGRGFAPDERSADSGVVVISNRTARRLWPASDPIGRTLNVNPFRAPRSERLDAGAPAPQLPPRAFTVVGVVRDVRVGLEGFDMTGADVYLPVAAERPGTSLALRLRGDPELALQQLAARLSKIDPAVGTMWTLRQRAGSGLSVLRTAFWITAALGILALALTLSGIFSVLSYLVEQRRHEIGVRMALGATAQGVAGLVLAQSLRPVIVGLVLGGALAGSLVKVLMTMPAAGQIGSAVRVADPVVYAASVLFIVTASVVAAAVPALRAARIEPLLTLRNE